MLPLSVRACVRPCGHTDGHLFCENFAFIPLGSYWVVICLLGSFNKRNTQQMPIGREVRSSVRPCVRPLSKFGVHSITFERLHQFNSNFIC